MVVASVVSFVAVSYSDLVHILGEVRGGGGGKRGNCWVSSVSVSHPRRVSKYGS